MADKNRSKLVFDKNAKKLTFKQFHEHCLLLKSFKSKNEAIREAEIVKAYEKITGKKVKE